MKMSKRKKKELIDSIVLTIIFIILLFIINYVM